MNAPQEQKKAEESVQQQPIRIPEIRIPAEQPQTSRSENSATSDTPASGASTPIGTRKYRHNNGWTKEIEELMANWADVATCYRWLHDRTEKMFSAINSSFTIPLIALTTLTGSANIAIGSIIGEDKEAQKWANLAIGGISILTGIFTTIANRFKFEARAESSRGAGMSWGKFQRLIAVELSLHSRERMDSIDFLKICRNELDRLIEQTPPVPDRIIKQFERKFGHIPNLKKPDICDHIEHTYVYQDKESRMKEVATNAALMLRNKKQLLKELVEADLHKKVDTRVEETVAKMSQDVKKQLENELGNHVRIHVEDAVDGKMAVIVAKERASAHAAQVVAAQAVVEAKAAAEVSAAQAAAQAVADHVAEEAAAKRKRSMSPATGFELSSRVQDFLVGNSQQHPK